jgi:hypothetical protein
MESMGFVYSDYVTKKMRKIANQDFRRYGLVSSGYLLIEFVLAQT